ncbi:MAG: glycine cleavage system protein GcvH [Rhizomicrobium sp.]
MTVRYTDQHEWIAADGTVGITKYAAELLGDVVFVELPEVGKVLAKGDVVSVVETVKAASEVYSPLAGEISAQNTVLGDDPARLGADPEGDAWIFKIKIADPAALDGLMTAEAYAAFVKGL